MEKSPEQQVTRQDTAGGDPAGFSQERYAEDLVNTRWWDRNRREVLQVTCALLAGCRGGAPYVTPQRVVSQAVQVVREIDRLANGSG